jgi:1,4-alpha-glucan branching enzyme
MLKNLSFFTAFILGFTLNAQVTCIPVFPSPDDDITLTYDAKQGSAGLADETGDVYAHTGVLTDKSTSASDWKYVKFPWTTNDPSVRMTRVGNGIYTLTIPKIRTFYNVPATEKIQKLAMVFRNGTRTKEGKTSTGGDIFYDLVTDFNVLQTRLIAPVTPVVFTAIGQTIEVKAAASLAGTVSFTDNGVVVKTATNVKDLTHTLTVNTEGVHTVRFKVESGTKVDSSASFTYVTAPVVATANVPINMELGANINAKGDSVTFLFQAPNKQNVFVLGDFNGYKIDNDYLMKRSVDGKTWWLTVKGLTPGQNYTYQYLVDGAILIADPLSTLVLDPANDGFVPSITYPNIPAYPVGKTSGIVSVIQPGKAAYNWKIKNFTRPDKRDLIIYELLLRDFVARHDYQTLIDTLPYLKRLGITAIELMPINEYDGNESWGYNPSFHNALDKYYGTADKFKEFVDKCHENGMAVISDIVFNHASGNSPLAQLYWSGNQPAATSPFLNPTAPHPYSVFNDMNHTSEFTRNYVARCLKYWLTEYNIDGYRFDLSKGFTQNVSSEGTASFYDQSRIDNLKYYHNIIQGVSPTAYTILEHFAETSEETALAKAGMMVWGNGNGDFNEATMGWQKNKLTQASAKRQGWSVDSLHNKYVAYMESHDEERLMYKNIQFGNSTGVGYNVKDLATGLKRVELASAFFYTIPGPRMLWQFGELGYDYSINTNGRVGNKPIRWDFLQDENRNRLFKVTQNLIHLRKTNPVFQSINYNETELGEGYLKAFHLKDNDMSVTVLGNFDVAAAEITPNFQSTGKWYNYLAGDSITVSSTSAPIRLLPGEYRVYTSKKVVPPAGIIRFSTTALKDFAEEANEFMVYPNPSSSGNAFIGYNLKKGGAVQWTVFNTLGQAVTASALQNLTAGSYQEGLKDKLPQGVYLVKLSVNGAVAARKIVVE